MEQILQVLSSRYSLWRQNHADRTDSAQPPNARFGLKELHPGINPDVDIVAIHGIDGDREESWTADNGVLWLRDLLPAEIPNARILTYGYDANTHGQEQLATDFMHEHAMNFISRLVLLRDKTDTVERPIIFVAHSSGGLLLKSALIHSHLCNDNHLKNHRGISQSTYGIAFFGTPHQGSATAELARSILKIGSPSMPSNDVLLRHLVRDSEALQQTLALYPSISGQFETKFFYEIYKTNVAGVSIRVVPKDSAVVPGAVNAEAIGIYKDHIHLVKFLSVDDEDFSTVSSTLSLMSKSALKCDRYKSTINLKEVTLTSSQKKALSRLQCVHSARFNAETRPRCLEGTRVDLLKTIIEWTEQESSEVRSRIFWLSGQAGTGKSTVSLTVASDCQEKGRLGASFFFSRDHADRNDLQLVFPTLAQQLGIFHPPFQVLLSEAIEKDPAITQLKPEYQFEKLIVEPIRLCGSFPVGTIITIDALDECKDEKPISTMLSILSSHIHKFPHLKFFITSRPEDHVRGGFRPLFPVTQTVTLHDIEASVVDADIERYLRHGFSITVPLLYPALKTPDWPSNESIQSLVKKSSRLFIFSATAMKFILDRNYSDPHSQLALLLRQSPPVRTSSSPFAFLDQLYHQVLRQAFPSGTTPRERLNLIRTILGAIVLLQNPLSPGTLESLLGFKSGTVRTTLRHLHSVIVVPDTDDHPIQLIHPSFFDFLTTRCRADFRVKSLECHELLALACFRQMKTLNRGICQIQDASKLNEGSAEQYISAPLRYACLNWPFHLFTCKDNSEWLSLKQILGLTISRPRNFLDPLNTFDTLPGIILVDIFIIISCLRYLLDPLNTFDTSLQGILREFCSGQILYWMEAISLLYDIPRGFRLHFLSEYLKIFSIPSEHLAALSDCTRFRADYFELMKEKSLRLYRPALLFSAPSGFLRKTTSHHELNSGPRVLHGEWMGEMFSGVIISHGMTGWINSRDCILPDGFYSNDDQLWRRGTGTSLQTFKAEPYSSFRWSRSFRLAMGRTYTISMWNIATGTCFQTIDLRRINWQDALHSFTISPDFTHIAGCAGNEVYIWHTSNGNLLKTLYGHSDKVTSVVFSPIDHMLIASTSTDHTIRIWDAINFTQLKTFRGHSSSVHSVAFSSDCEYIISGSRDGDIRLWDANSGVNLRILRGHLGEVESVAFDSPNGTRA